MVKPSTLPSAVKPGPWQLQMARHDEHLLTR